MAHNMGCYPVNFGALPMPPGIHVEWWDQDEHYHWVCAGTDSDIYACRFHARRDAWAFYRDTGDVS